MKLLLSTRSHVHPDGDARLKGHIDFGAKETNCCNFESGMFSQSCLIGFQLLESSESLVSHFKFHYAPNTGNVEIVKQRVQTGQFGAVLM